MTTLRELMAKGLLAEPKNKLRPEKPSLLGALRDPLFYKDMAGNVPDTLRGLLAQTAGAPVDIATTAMRPFGYNVPSERVVGGTDWIGQKLGADTNKLPFQISSMIPSDASDLMKYGGAAMALAGKVPKLADQTTTAAKLVDDYAGAHRPPMRDSGAPLYDLTGGGTVYPDDIYSSNADRYYGHFGGGDPMDRETISLIHSMRGKPHATVTVYRAVPYEKTSAEQLADLEKQMAEFMRRGKAPDGSTGKQGSAWYDKAYDLREQLRNAPAQAAPKLDINKGDWITVNRNYAKDHGESTLNGKYKIISKKVRAKDIYTNGDSIHEFGYDPE